MKFQNFSWNEERQFFKVNSTEFMPGVARDDIASLKLRASGTTIVCAVITAVNPPTIRDNSGTYEIAGFPAGYSPIEGDVALFLFNCNSASIICERVTAIPPDIVPVYINILKKYKEEFS